MTLAFSPTQPDNTPFTTVTSKPKKAGKFFFIPFNSDSIDCDSRFNTSLYLNRYPNCCNKDATLHKKRSTTLIKLKQAISKNEVFFDPKNRENKKVLEKALDQALNEGLGNKTYPIHWSRTAPLWQ